MQLRIATDNGVPIYRQIVNQIQYLVAANRLHPGDEVPSIRRLAQDLLINPNTVARAYRELETAGLLQSRQGAGTTVVANPSPLNRREKIRILAERADGLLAEARQLGISVDDLKELLDKRSAKLDET